MASAADARRAREAGGGGVEVEEAEDPRRVRHRLVDEPREEFNTTMLAYFYRNLFPFRAMFRWLAYGNDPTKLEAGNVPDFFHRREFTFTLEGDVFVRYMCFKDAEEFAKAVQGRNPERIEIGPVYTASPDKNKVLKKDVFKPVERELIFDIDMNDYDDIRTCCKGASVCKKCWAFVNVAMRVLDSVLREDFNFQHLLFVFSGRRGAHAWVSDEAARKLSDEQRAAVLMFVNVFSTDTSSPAGYGGGAPAGGGGGGGGGAGSSDKHLANFFRVLNGLTVPLHPALQRAYRQLDGMFERFIVSEEGQGLLASPENWEKVLSMMPTEGYGEELQGVFRGAWPRASSAAQRWGQLKATVTSLIKRVKESKGGGGKTDFAQLRTLEKLLPAIVFTFTYPRLDVEVSKHRNHLLKAPFCIHPKTGKICVPMRLSTIDDFDPNKVPTCRALMDEGNTWLRERGGAPATSEEDKAALVAATSLKPFVAEFDSYIKEIGVSLQRNKRAVIAAKERQGAALGDW